MSNNNVDLVEKYSLPLLKGPMSGQAEIVRMDLTRSLEEAVCKKFVSVDDRFYHNVTKLLSEQRDPLFYINHRKNSLLFNNSCYYKSLQKKNPFDLMDTPFTLISPKQKFSEITELCMIDSDSFSIHYEYCENFITIMRTIKAEFNKEIQSWIFTSGVTSGSLLDRAAETVTRLLNAGFNVVVYDPIVIEKVKTSDWEPVYQRWITYHLKKDCFIVNYETENEKLLNDLKKIRGHFVRYNTFFVRKTSFLDLYAFGKAYAFKYSEHAGKVMEELRNKIIPIKNDLPIHKSSYEERNIEVVEGIPDDLYDD